MKRKPQERRVVQRKMMGFHEDGEAQWVSDLACGHTQHVRHKPPFTLRPWVLTREGRAERIGQTLDCPLCDRREMPEGFAPYKRTASFARESIPEGLLRRHSLKSGVWGILHVVRGELEFFEPCETGETRRALVAGERAVVLPESEHRVAAPGDVEFFIEFWRSKSAW